MGLPQEDDKKTRSISGKMESQVKTTNKKPYFYIKTEEDKIAELFWELPFFTTDLFRTESHDDDCECEYTGEYRDDEDYEDFEEESRDCDAWEDFLAYHEHDVEPLPLRAFYY